MTKKKQEGGPEWERNEAAKKIARAVAAADEAAIAEGADRLGDAVTNATAERLIPTLEKTLKSVVRPSIDKLVEAINQNSQAIEAVKVHQDQRFAYLIRITELEFRTNAAWRDEYGKVIDRLDVGQGELKADHIQLRAELGGAIARIEQIETLLAARPAERDAEHQAIVEEIGDKIDTLITRLETDERRLDRKRSELDDMHEWQAKIETRLAELEAKRRTNDADGDR